jgi:outer membrane murein-binding lipoprotein Lpp
VRVSRGAAAVALLGVLLVSGCHAAPTASAPTATTSADPLSDVESTVDAVEHDVDADADG